MRTSTGHLTIGVADRVFHNSKLLQTPGFQRAAHRIPWWGPQIADGIVLPKLQRTECIRDVLRSQ
ncbi:MAG: hypothetical protein WCB44_23025, partial [Stellaceae bacterium]